MQQILGLVKRLLTRIPKRYRGAVFAVVLLGLITLAVLDHYDVGPVDGWIGQVIVIAGIASNVLALANLRDPGDTPPDTE